MNTNVARVFFPNFMLSQRHNTCIKLTFSASNRSAFDGIYIRVSYGKFTSGTFVGRNSSASLTLQIPPQLLGKSICIDVENSIPTDAGSLETFKVKDLIGIDNIILKRDM